MKNLYGKSKGKIHPDGVGGAALQAALAILPAAILALAAALSPEDREVLAYLVARSLRGAAPVEDPQPQPMRWRSSKGKGNAGGPHHHHKHGFECGCFDCYRGFWCRWDASPDREVIHQAIEAFEEHLSSGEMEMEMANNKGGRRRGGKGKNKGKGAKGSTTGVGGEGANGKTGKGTGDKRSTTADNKANKKNEADDKLATEHQPLQQVSMHTEELPAPVLAFPASSPVDVAEAAVLSSPPPMEHIQQQPEEEDHEEEEYYDDWKQQQTQPAVEPSNNTSCSVAAADYSMRRRGGGWADVMGLFNSRLWSLWSPGA